MMGFVLMVLASTAAVFSVVGVLALAAPILARVYEHYTKRVDSWFDWRGW